MSGEKVICQKFSDGVLLNIPHTFNVEQIAASGQCFRLTVLPSGGYIAITGQHIVKIAPRDAAYFFHCSFDDFRDVWIPYFDLAADYEVYQQAMHDDPFLQEALASG